MKIKNPSSHPFPTQPALAIVAVLVAFAPRPALADSLVPLWSVAPDERFYVGTANLERGIAFNPVSKNVLLVSRAAGPKVHVLRGTDGSDGSEETGEPRILSPLDETGEGPINGGTFTLNLVGAAADGAVYACNLATSIGTVRIYRWTDDAPETPVSVAYSGDPLEGIAEPGSGQDIRFGDNFAVRGAGAATQLVQTSRNGKYIVLYTTTDGLTFTATTIASPGDVAGKIGLGVAFGSGDTLWATTSGNALHRLQFNLAADGAPASVQLLGSVPSTVVSLNTTGVSFDPLTRRLATADYTAHTLSVFDASDPTGLIPVGDPVPFLGANANGNGTTATALGDDTVVGLDSNNGIIAVQVEKSVVVDPPVITAQPVGGTVYEGGAFTFGVAAQGTPPFGYQWTFNDSVPLPGATGAQFVITNVTEADAGTYSVTITNASDMPAVSSAATLVVRKPLNAGILRPAWTLLPGDRPYLTSDNTQRGLAFNPATGNLLVASRSPVNTIAVLDAATGTHRHNLRTTTAEETPVFVGGTLALNMIGVADEGAVYAANLITDASTAALQIYRWDNDSPDTVPVVTSLPPELSIAERWGDTLDVRGSGATTQILLGTRGVAPQEGRKFAVLTTTDGLEFAGQIFTVPDAPSTAFGLGIAFGSGNRVFGTANGQPVIQASFNPADGTATLDRTYAAPEIPTAVSFIAYHSSSNWLAGVALENPDNVLLHQFNPTGDPVLVDQRLILPKVPNANGTGSLDFGGNRLFVLDTNHGLRAFDISQDTTPAEPARLSQPRIAAGVLTFSLEGSSGRDYLVQKSTDLRGWTDFGTFRAPATVTDSTGPAPGFFRAIAK
ncbi:MAG: immunoglobulin domain-containing protein [Limisphaerales bacterium]